jgi:hypothetical protein
MWLSQDLLFRAVEEDKARIVRLLLDRGANPSIVLVRLLQQRTRTREGHTHVNLSVLRAARRAVATGDGRAAWIQGRASAVCCEGSTARDRRGACVCLRERASQWGASSLW